jgi:hypothetical protein
MPRTRAGDGNALVYQKFTWMMPEGKIIRILLPCVNAKLVRTLRAFSEEDSKTSLPQPNVKLEGKVLGLEVSHSKDGRTPTC